MTMIGQSHCGKVSYATESPDGRKPGMRLSLIALSAILLSGCFADSSTEEKVEETIPLQTDEAKVEKPVEQAEIETATPVLALDFGGLRSVDPESGATQLLNFGMTREAVEELLIEFLGDIQSKNSNEECGAGVMEFSNFGDLTANFQDGAFVGWFLGNVHNDISLTTIDGIGIGTTRSEMEQSLSFDIFEDSSLGVEFYTGGEEPGGLSGLFDDESPDAKINSLWAGTNCHFR